MGTNKRKIILASSSPRRKSILLDAGVSFEVVEPLFDENIPRMTETPAEFSKKLAFLKASPISTQYSNCIVIGADTIIAIDDQILGKPKDLNDAYNMLWYLQGREHEVITGLSILIHEERYNLAISDVTKVTIAKMTKAEIQNYINVENVLDAAGSYKIQGRFNLFIEKIEGSYENVIGLPIRKIYEALDSCYFDTVNNKV